MMFVSYSYVGFFFSSRRRHTRYIGDWSSDRVLFRSPDQAQVRAGFAADFESRGLSGEGGDRQRSEERRVGKECRSRWAAYYLQKKTVRWMDDNMIVPTRCTNCREITSPIMDRHSHVS